MVRHRVEFMRKQRCEGKVEKRLSHVPLAFILPREVGWLSNLRLSIFPSFLRQINSLKIPVPKSVGRRSLGRNRRPLRVDNRFCGGQHVDPFIKNIILPGARPQRMGA